MGFAPGALTTAPVNVTTAQAHNTLAVILDDWSLQSMTAAMDWLLGRVSATGGDPTKAMLAAVIATKTFTVTWDAPAAIT